MRKIGLETEYAHCNNSFDPELDDGSARAKALFNSPNHCPVKYADNLFSIGDKLTYQDGDHCKLDRGFFDSGSYSLEYVSAPVGLDLAFTTLAKSDERVERLSQGTGIRLFRSSLDYWNGCDIPSLLGTHYNFDAPVIMLVEGHDYHRPGPTGYPVLFGANRLLLDQLIALAGYVAGSGYYCRLRNEVVPHERLYGMSWQRADRMRDFRWQPMLRQTETHQLRTHITQLETFHLEWSMRVTLGLVDLAVMMYGFFNLDQLPWFTNIKMAPDELLNHHLCEPIRNNIHLRNITVLDLLSVAEDWLVTTLDAACDYQVAERCHKWAVEQYALALKALRQNDRQLLVGLSEWLTLDWLLDIYQQDNPQATPDELASISLEFKAVESPLRDELKKQFPVYEL